MAEVVTGNELDPEMVRAKLKGWFQSKMPQARELSVSPLKMAGTGLSNQTFFLDLEWRENGERKLERLVIRWAPKGYKLYYKYDMREQFLLKKHLENTGVPVPRARWLEEDESMIGSPFYIVDRVDGWIPGENPPYRVAGPIYEGTPEYRSKIWWKAVDMMAKINTLDWEKAGLGFLGIPKAGTTEPIEREIAFYEKLSWMDGRPHPILEATTDWLKKNRFAPKYVSLLWGDPRLGNLVYRNDEVVAVLDWELSRLGDPESDLAWFLYLEGMMSEASPPLDGLPGDEEIVQHYQRVTNREVENLFYHDILATWRFAVIASRLELPLKAKGYVPPDEPIDLAYGSREKLRMLLAL